VSDTSYVDGYIAASAAFAQPILTELRRRVHVACPDVTEAKKWSSPAFLYGGKILAHMAAFKAHATFGFHHGDAVDADPVKLRSAMGNFGKLTTLTDLPDEAQFARLAASAIAAIDLGVKKPRKALPKPQATMPPVLAAALAAHPLAQAAFDAFSPSAQREYMEWIGAAKQDATRDRRLTQALEWIAEGKGRNWKYQHC
jgi:uncharacterized protein YdeI (YjbR/CyaY-like superfamily)